VEMGVLERTTSVKFRHLVRPEYHGTSYIIGTEKAGTNIFGAPLHEQPLEQTRALIRYTRTCLVRLLWIRMDALIHMRSTGV
jgi:hypothetical protein